MPVTYWVSETDNFVHTVATGIFSEDDLIGHVQALATDPRVRARYRELLDARGVTHVEGVPEIFDRMAAVERQYPHKFTGHKVAILTLDQQMDAIARLFEQQTMGGSMTVIVFTTLDVALSWLKVGRGESG